MAAASAKGLVQQGASATNLIIQALREEDSQLQVIRMHVDVDGAPVFDTADAARLQSAEQVIPAPAVAAGPHTLKMTYVLVGTARSKLQAYRFHVRSLLSFTVEPASIACIPVVLTFSRGATAPKPAPDPAPPPRTVPPRP